MAGPRSSTNGFVSNARKIASTSRDLLTFLNSTRPQPQAPTNHLAVPPLVLPLPDELLEVISSYDLPTILLEDIRRVAQKSLAAIQASCQTKYANTCQSLAHLPNTRSTKTRLQEIQKTYLNLYNTKLAPRFREQLVSQLNARQTAFQPKKQVFNVHYIPVLEKYFEYNAYPTAQDRALLARKSMMTARQIEVWFQNHRRRARNEGRSLQRPSPDCIPVQICLESLEQEMAPFVARKRERSPTVAPNPQVRFPTPPADLPPSNPPATPTTSGISKSESILDSVTAPAHAYPTKFSELTGLGFGPFPCKRTTVSLPAPIWAPMAITPRKEVCSLNELCDAFSTMRIAGPSAKASTPSPWYSSRCSGPFPSPHPALVRVSRPCPSPEPEPSPASSRKSKTLRSASDSSYERSNKRRKTTTSPERRMPSSLPSKSLSRASSNSSLSSHTSCSEIETPDNSPYSSGTTSLPSVYGLDGDLPNPPSSAYLSRTDRFTAFDSYAYSRTTFKEALFCSLSISRTRLSA